HAGDLGNGLLEQPRSLATNFGPRKVDPVTFPPGRARLATSPSFTGSCIVITTMGMVTVACFAARASAVLPATMRSTLRRTSSAARVGNRSIFPSADPYSRSEEHTSALQ